MKPSPRNLIILFVLIGIALAASSPALGLSPSEPSRVYILILKDQPQIPAAYQVQVAYQQQFRSRMDELRQLQAQASNLRFPSAPPAPGVAPAPPLSPQQEARQAKLLFELQGLRRQVRQAILDQSTPARQASQAQVIRQIAAQGGQVLYRYESLNAITARLSSQALEALRRSPQVAQVFEDHVMTPALNVSTHAIGVDAFWPGYTGAGVNVAVIDTGIDQTHPALSGHTYAGQRCLTVAEVIDPSIATIDPSQDDVNGHGTHVAGIVASADSTYRGVAYGLNALLNGKAGFSTNGVDNSSALMYWSDEMECVDWALLHNPYGADVINLSFGSSTSYDDGPHEQFWDGVVSQMGVVVAIAAGNSGGPEYKLTSPAIAYNVISVANINDFNTINRSDDSLNSSSSRGPTYGGRKKPDLAAPGSSIISTDNSWEGSNPDFISYTGTSMAAPHMAGAAALLVSRGVSDPKAVKALLINTAEDKGAPGWDPGYGWGYINLTQVAGHLTDYFLDSLAPNPAYHLYAGPALSSDAATLVWNRRAVYNDATYPLTIYTLTNLDLYAYDSATGDVITNSLSLIDNVEQVRFTNTYSETVIKVDTTSLGIEGVSSEEYALATGSGYTARTGPALHLYPYGTGNLQGPAGSQVSVSLLIGNQGDLNAHQLSITLSSSPGLELSGGPTIPALTDSVGVGELSPPYTWNLVKTDDSPQTIRFNVSSISYGEVFTATVSYSGSQFIPLVTR